MNNVVVRWWFATALVAGVVTGCAEISGTEPAADDTLMRDDMLVPIAREVEPADIAVRSAAVARHALRTRPSETFYLAVRKSALQHRWFWSIYLTQLQPYGPSPGTMGTRVVRFREQNGKLFVFDADDRRATSDVFHPELIVDAFPIVRSRRFEELPGSGDYVLIDPAAGLNRFGALTDFFAMGEYATKLETELSFVQDFHAAPDGGRYEQIITAYDEVASGDPTDTEPNELRYAATMTVNLRRYTEDPSFVRVPAPPVPHYFLGAPYRIPNTGRIEQDAVKWNVRPGMQPIVWKISPEILRIQQDPALGGPDLFAAMKRGIESWNHMFGYPVFTAELASADDSFGDDRINYLIVDPDRSMGFAYANWRLNPNTSEIRGASVYFGGGFFEPFPDDPELAKRLAGREQKPVRSLRWLDHRADPLCVRWAPAWQPGGAPELAPSPGLTGAQKLELYIQEVTAHEIGHTLGLRHNFKGSLVPPTSTVMEYNLPPVAFDAPGPGPYDRQAIQHLYGASAQLPTLPFCTDADTLVDPNCVRFDRPSPTPLYDDHIPEYTFWVEAVLQGALPPRFVDLAIRTFGGKLYAFVRAGTPQEAAAAWNAAIAPVRAPVDPTFDPAIVNAVTAAVFRELILAPTAANRRPITQPAVLAAIANDARLLLINSDGLRSFEVRRLIVDALAKLQRVEAYVALLQAREAIAAQLPGLDPIARALTEDLLARINAATSPYYK